MRRIGGYFLLSLGLALLAGNEVRSSDGPSPGSPGPSELNPYLYQENMLIDGPSDYWLMAVARSQAVTKALWCSTDDPAEEIVRIDGQFVRTLTREEVAAYFSGAHGWPVHLIVKPHSGGAREVDCFDHP
jgi:hypothetical protein